MSNSPSESGLPFTLKKKTSSFVLTSAVKHSDPDIHIYILFFSYYIPSCFNLKIGHGSLCCPVVNGSLSTFCLLVVSHVVLTFLALLR